MIPEPIYSHLNEQTIISQYLKALERDQQGTCVDIGALDGITMSNTFSLFKSGWKGLAIECESHKFLELAYHYRDLGLVALSKCKVTPDNVCQLLKAHGIPVDFDFLSLDIDSYDYFVLEQILQNYRPALICTEINEKIPPPLKFTVKWDPDFVWTEDHFYGQSISQLFLLSTRFKYSLVKLHYNNAFLIPSEISPFDGLSPQEAYRQGYQDKLDRLVKLPWNLNMEHLQVRSAEDAYRFLQEYFAKYQGQFDLSL